MGFDPFIFEFEALAAVLSSKSPAQFLSLNLGSQVNGVQRKLFTFQVCLQHVHTSATPFLAAIVKTRLWLQAPTTLLVGIW